MASKPCCDAGEPVHHEYTPKGSSSNVDGRTLYTVGSGTKAIIFVHDIFGFDYKQVFQVADRLADQGYVVAVPDMFMGDTWPLSKFPPPDEETKNEFMAWIDGTANREKTAMKVKEVQKYLKEKKSVSTFGCIGFCWGGSVSLTLAGDDSFAAVACCHSAFFGKEKDLAEAAIKPVCVLPTKDDPMDDIKEILDKKDFGDKCFYKRYDDQVHGFLAARGDYKDEKVAKRAGEALEDLTKFFNSTM